MDVSYEPDLWGRVRRLVEANRSEAQATAADLANVQLSLQAELAIDYFELRGLDAQKKLLDSTVESYREGAGADADAATRAEWPRRWMWRRRKRNLRPRAPRSIDVGVNRAAFEHAIAVLVGKPASTFSSSTAVACKRRRRRCRRECRPICWSGGPISPRPRGECKRPTRKSAWQKRLLSECDTARPAEGSKAARSEHFIQGASGFWTLAGSAAELIFDGGQRRGR